MHQILREMPMNIQIHSLKAIAFMAMSLSLTSWAGGSHDGHTHSHGKEEAAIGQPGEPSKVSRTITIEMSDAMRFTPATFKVRQGETVRLLVVNTGQIRHELSLGTQKELREHLALMKKFPDMEHDEPNSVTLDPGKHGEIVWQFTRAGAVHFACLIPGHYEAGMKGAVQVSKQ